MKPLTPRRSIMPTRWLLQSLFGCSALLGSAHASDAGFAPQVWLNPGVISHHFDRSGDFREDNIGIGAEVVVAPAHALMLGTFINSDRTRTRYGAYQWRPCIGSRQA